MMTSYSPRIYLYKITFEEVPYYYYGVHKEKYFNEKYWGTPVTHKWIWNFYTPKKQILQFFDFTDEGWMEAREIEIRLIRPFYVTDKWCLNESCGGIVSLQVSRESGKKSYNLGVGIHGRTKKQMSEDGKKGDHSKGGKKSKELGVGIHGRTKKQIIEDGRKGAEKQKEIRTGAVYGKSKEQRIENGRTCGNKTKELCIGIHGRTKEERVEDARKGGLIGGKKAKELGLGIFGLTEEQMSENGKRNGNKMYELGLGIHGMSKEQRSQHSKKINSQKWMCTETGFISTPGSLTNYQKNRGIDTSKRKRIE